MLISCLELLKLYYSIWRLLAGTLTRVANITMIKKRIFKTAILMSLAIVQTAPAFAASSSPGLMFFGVGTGRVDYSSATFVADAFKSQLPASFSVNTDDRDSGLRITGGYQFNKNVAAVVSFTDLGQFAFGGTGVLGPDTIKYEITTDTFGVELGGELSLPLLDNKLIPYVKAGLFIWSSEGELTVTVLPASTAHGSDSDNGIDSVYGFGANYFFNDYIGVGLAWNRYDIGEAYDANGFKVDFLSLSIFMTPGY